MALEVGRRLGAYEITGAIGAGGMGEVYRAKDTKLDRDVAIKTLPDDFAHDPERLARFKREAQVLASLNHPNIAAIHGLEEEDSQPFLVLELVEGEDLAERLKRGPIAVDEVLEIAKQIAEALEEAHEKGIIHRDLKPANVKLTPEGVVKVLDFGLAKALSGEATQDVNISDSPTLARNETGTGVIFGTAAYMSPEQAKGKGVDRRADIWSFGALVYEMLTGAKAFARDDVSETLAAILRDEPDWKRLPATTPPRLRALIKRCLHKNPRERQRDMGDARLELITMDDASVSVQAPNRSGRALVAALAGFALGAIMIGAFSSSDQPAAPLVTKMAILLPEGQRLVERLSSPIAVSPDGRSVAYAAEDDEGRRVYLRRLDTDQPEAIAGTDGGHTPFFSPDGSSIGFFTDDALRKVSLAGGLPMTLAAVETSLGAHWGDDGTIVYVPTSGARAVVMGISQAGGTAEPLTEIGQLWQAVAPQILPNGGPVLFGTGSGERLYTVSRETREPVLLESPEGRAARYLPTGHLISWLPGSLSAVPFDASQLTPRGEGAVVLGEISWRGGVPFYSVSDNGTLAYVTGAQARRSLALVNRSGESHTLVDVSPHAPRVSPDGNRILYDSLQDLWLYDIERTTTTRLTVSEETENAVWSTDGLSFAIGRNDTILTMPADGTGVVTPLRQGLRSVELESWSRNGRFIAYTESAPSTGLDMWILPVGAEPIEFLVTPANENAATFSPNDRFIAFVSDRSGRNEVYVRPFPGPGNEWKISTNGGTAPVWSVDGQELFYREGRGMMAVDVDIEDAFNAGKPNLLFTGDFVVDNSGHAGYDVMPDGSGFLMIQEHRQPLTEIHVVINWFEELNRLVPIE